MIDLLLLIPFVHFFFLRQTEALPAEQSFCWRRAGRIPWDIMGVSAVQEGWMGASRRWGQRMPLLPGLASSPAPGILACRVLKQSLDHPERLLKQELPFFSHLVCCCRCLFGFGFILAVSFIFTFGGLFLLLKLTKQQAISMLYCIKVMNVSCSGLLKVGRNRSNIINLLFFFSWLML